MNNKPKKSEKEISLLAQRIKELRKKAGYSSYENFAYDHNITRSQWGRYERGEDMRFSSLVKVCKALDISLKEFFEQGFEKNNTKKEQTKHPSKEDI
jgi:transcriptional regulator with XRE-family HTH domain